LYGIKAKGMRIRIGNRNKRIGDKDKKVIIISDDNKNMG